MTIDDWGERPSITICRSVKARPDIAQEPDVQFRTCELCDDPIFVAPSTFHGVPSHLVCDRCGLALLMGADPDTEIGMHPGAKDEIARFMKGEES